MKVLLLSVKAGYGHHSTAKAIMEYFEENGHQCHMLDIFDYVNHRLGNSIQGRILAFDKVPCKDVCEGLRQTLRKETSRMTVIRLYRYFSRFVSKET